MRFVEGDLTETPREFVAHGCNTRGKFGKGVALAVAKKWPEVKNLYMRFYELGALKLGHSFYRRTNDGKVVFNLLTQDDYGSDGRKYASYIALVHSVESMLDTILSMDQRKVSSLMGHTDTIIAIPKIGCSLGGLDWAVVHALLLEIEQIHNVEFEVYF